MGHGLLIDGLNLASLSEMYARVVIEHGKGNMNASSKRVLDHHDHDVSHAWRKYVVYFGGFGGGSW